MIKSMTGYGRELAACESRDILVELRSVNHRYYEFSARVPRIYGYLEEKLKAFLSGKIARGKVEVSVSIFNSEAAGEEIEVNHAVAKGYIDALTRENELLSLENDLALSHLLRLSDVFNVKKLIEDEDVVWDAVRPVAEAALDRFIKMRITEGESMKSDISARLDFIENAVGKIEARSPQVTESYKNRLFAKLSEILSDRSIDQQRILTEAAIFSEKTAVDEETVRLRSHIAQARTLIESNEAVGRKLDFLIQEINREVNTIGSKAQDLDITRMVVDMKSEIEKIREQIQNIE